MGKYLRCDKSYKEMIQEITKQRVIMITMSIMGVFEVKKVGYEMSGHFAKVGAPQAQADNNVFHTKRFDLNLLFSYCKILVKVSY